MSEDSATDFDRLVSDALDELPDDIRGLMTNVAVTVEDEPPPGQPLLGLYEAYRGAGAVRTTRAPCRTRSRSTGSRSSASRAAIPSVCAPRCGASSSTRSRTTSGSATSGWWISTATSSRR
jgi:hypothetical protein